VEINISSYRAMVKHLAAIEVQLTRIACVLEFWVNETLPMGYVRQADLTKEQREVEISYVDEEAEVLNEVKKAMGRKDEVEEE